MLFLGLNEGDVFVAAVNELYYKGLQPNEVLQVNKTHLKFEIGDVSLKLDNLFGGDPIMGNFIIILFTICLLH